MAEEGTERERGNRGAASAAKARESTRREAGDWLPSAKRHAVELVDAVIDRVAKDDGAKLFTRGVGSLHLRCDFALGESAKFAFEVEVRGDSLESEAADLSGFGSRFSKSLQDPLNYWDILGMTVSEAEAFLARKGPYKISMCFGEPGPCWQAIEEKGLRILRYHHPPPPKSPTGGEYGVILDSGPPRPVGPGRKSKSKRATSRG